MYIGMDIGGTNVRIASTESLTHPKIKERVAFRSEPKYEDNLYKIKEIIDGFKDTVEGIGVGTPGKLNDEKTSIIFTRYASQWAGKPLVQDLINLFGCPAILDGDSPTGALGEALYGENTVQDFCYLAYGTGIGSASVTFLDSKPHVKKVTDAEHAAYLHPWQRECGGRGIENTMGKPAASLTESEWGTVMGKFYSHMLRFLEYFQPQVIVFGGGVATKQWPRIQLVVNQLFADHPELNANTTLTSLGEDTGLYGAFGLLRDNM